MKYGVLAAAMVTALALGILGTQPQQPREAQAGSDQLTAVALNQSLCIALGSAFGGLDTVVAATGCQGATVQGTFQKLAACLENIKVAGVAVCPSEPAANTVFFRPEPDTFDGLDLDKNQIFELQPYLIIAYVSDDSPVRFISEKGNFLTPDGVTTGQDFFCSPDNPLLVGVFLDPDCDGDAATVGDGVVVARLLTTAADGDSGTFSVSAIQEGIAFPMEMTLTGPPESIELVPLFGKDTVQTVSREQINTSEVSCTFGASADAVLGAVGKEYQTIVVAKAFDDNGVEVVGALINWHLQAGFPDDASSAGAGNGTWALNKFKTGGVALPGTPTLDTGPLGVAFPQFVCGGTDEGTIDLVARFDVVLSSAADPDEHEEISINVIGGATEMSLAAVPPQIDCDGVTSSAVTATLTTATGDPTADGVDVRFDVVALGTANPIIVSSAAGAASTTVIPLASANNQTADGGPKGVTVIATALGNDGVRIQRSILVACTGGPPPPGGDPGAGGTAPPPPPPSGTITPPDTGSGGQAPGVPIMALAALGMGAMALVGTRLAVRGK